MADKQISELVAATALSTSDLLVCEQGGVAKKVPGTVLRKLGVDVDCSMTSTEYNTLSDLLGLSGGVAMGNPFSGGLMSMGNPFSALNEDALGEDLEVLEEIPESEESEE